MQEYKIESVEQIMELFRKEPPKMTIIEGDVRPTGEYVAELMIEICPLLRHLYGKPRGSKPLNP